MKPYLFLFLNALLVWAVAILSGAERPHFVFIVSEDNSHHYLEHFFAGGAKSPAIEALAAQGLTFDHAFSNAPVCSVARTTLATACFGPRIGTQFHRRHLPAVLPENIRMWQTYLQQAGYYTTNHSKTDYNAAPATGWDDSSNQADWRNRKEGQPFFHMESHASSHESALHFSQVDYENKKTTTDPGSVALAPYFPDTPLFRYTHAFYLDRMKVIDDAVAAAVKKLEDDGLLEDTFVFYFGDHGGVLPRGKGYLYESGLHVPLVIRVPENFKHLVNANRGVRVKGFVNFIDFGPTVLNLAGVKGSDAVDGRAFLGKEVSLAEVNQRDESYGYADRMDEKYDMVRSLRKGKFHYLRCYQNWLPDGLQNNYRYKMLAYQEWRILAEEGSLDDTRSRFFRPKPVELLFDVETDPHETTNLAGEATHRATLEDLRKRLKTQLKSWPDLSFFPESHLVAHAMKDPVGFGQKNKERIARYVDIADLATGAFSSATVGLKAALSSSDPIARYWGLMVCSSFASKAASLAPMAEGLLREDENEVVRWRAAEFLGLIHRIDPYESLVRLINSTQDPVFATEALNSLVYFVDHHDPSTKFDPGKLEPKVKSDGVERRIGYLKGEPLEKPKTVVPKRK